jgi:hypothetical protein
MLTLALARLTLPAVVGRRLNEGLGHALATRCILEQWSQCVCAGWFDRNQLKVSSASIRSNCNFKESDSWALKPRVHAVHVAGEEAVLSGQASHDAYPVVHGLKSERDELTTRQDLPSAASRGDDEHSALFHGRIAGGAEHIDPNPVRRCRIGGTGG